MSADAPVGVFDSGIGGLTVLREVIGALPGESTVYLGDTARVPYGIRSPETVRRYALECMQFLLSRGVKLLVIACNTASAIALEDLRAQAGIPVIGVIEAGALAAAASTRTGRIAVIGTEATVRSGAYERALSKEAEGLGKGIAAEARACPLFVPLAEEGWTSGEIARLSAERYLGDLAGKSGEDRVDTLLLGCTHYPLLKETLAEVMGPDVTLIDSARETAREVRSTLESMRLINPGGPGEGRPRREFFVTDSPGRFRSIGERFLGSPIEEINQIELSRKRRQEA